MDAKQIAKHMIAFSKTDSDNNFNSIIVLHEQMEMSINNSGKNHPSSLKKAEKPSPIG